MLAVGVVLVVVGGLSPVTVERNAEPGKGRPTQEIGAVREAEGFEGGGGARLFPAGPAIGGRGPGC